MKTNKLKIIILSLLILCCFVGEVLAQNIPQPMLCCGEWDNQGNCSGKLMRPEEYKRSCNRIKSSSSGDYHTHSHGLRPEQQMQLQMMQGILQPFFNSLFDFSDLFSPPDTSSQTDIERQRQEQLRKEQEQKEIALKMWIKTQVEVAAEEAMKKEEAEQILARSSITGGSGGFAPSSWSTSNRKLIPTFSSYETSKFTEMERLLCSAYFSKLAEDAMTQGNLEGSRFYANQVDNVIQGLPISIECKPPKELVSSITTKNAKELNKKYTRMAKLYRDITPKVEKLSDIQIRLDELVKKKEESRQKIEKLDRQIEELKAKAQTKDKPEKDAKTDGLLAEALELKSRAEKEYQEALESEQKLLKEKESLEKEINDIKSK
ncbi:hypothetical protein [Thermodesulfovibrio thiophilus]|uniref:hypothetical protein n=1 Tax=Thermodesulfovibrio thiophilus TaxID=340095 RepID=UPI00185AFF4D|nr:hypothetical protein [Thermodesulfovibrio thiophilus]HHW20392.1 hypothetical protein [Thermodesulfovibrio thiophilus]